MIYSDSKSTTPSWRIQAVSVEPGSFASRKALPEPWRGIRDSELDGLLNLETAKTGAVFVHASGTGERLSLNDCHRHSVSHSTAKKSISRALD